MGRGGGGEHFALKMEFLVKAILEGGGGWHWGVEKMMTLGTK